jgi:hypothetical protein
VTRARSALHAALVLSGCGPSFECDATVDDAVHTVLDVACTSSHDATSWIEYAIDGGDANYVDDFVGLTPEVGPTETHEHHLFGIPEMTDVHYTAHLDDGSTFEGTATTGPLIPTLQRDTEVTIDDPSAYDEPYLMMCQVGTEFQHITVYDRAGNIVWYHQSEPFVSAVEAVFDPENERILYMQQSLHFTSDVGAIYATNWLYDDLGSWRTELAHHGIELQKDGRVSYLALDARKVDLPEHPQTMVAGDKVMEIDLDTGETEELYSVWDHFTPTPTPRWNVATYEGMKDWSHANGAHYYEDTGNYLLSLANLDTIVEFRRSDGEQVDSLSPDDYSFFDKKGIADDGFEFQHDARWGRRELGELTMSMTSTNDDSEAIVYAVDRDARTMHEIWADGSDDGILYAFSLGQNIPLPNGNRIANYGSAGVVREVDPNEVVVWELKGGTGGTVAFAAVKPFTDFYTMQ